ncbi:VTT domain-containing protein [Lyngbya aestuarii]|uniref:VTT domain-containing protein n=1 Tax=Lyngbya aestuarii TaxID=118322 RepID=UPI00403E2D78
MRNELKPHRVSRKIKRFCSFSSILILIATLIIAQAKYFNVQEILRNALNWIDHLEYYKPIAFIVIYNLATVLFVPGAILTLGGGIIFGLVWGSVYVFIASSLGATCAFLIGRYLSRSWVYQQIEGNHKFQAIDRAVAREGFKIVFLTRLSPVFPFNLLNYAFGITQVSLKDYFFGSCGMIPGTVMYVYLGHLVGDLAMLSTTEINPQAKAARWGINLLGLILTIATTVYITYIAKKALEKSKFPQ